MAAWSPLDPTSVDLTDFDVADIVRSAVETTDLMASRAIAAAKDATYVTVGLGLLNYQRMQVRRRELERSVRG
jgi:hypothetical protein